MKILKAFGYDVVWMKYFLEIEGFTSIRFAMDMYVNHFAPMRLLTTGSHWGAYKDYIGGFPIQFKMNEHMQGEVNRGVTYLSLLDNDTVVLHDTEVINTFGPRYYSKETPEESYEVLKKACSDFCSGYDLGFGLDINSTMAEIMDRKHPTFDNKNFLIAAANAKADIPNDKPNGWIQSTYKWLMTKIEPETLQKYGAEYGLIEEA
jgi:hypothetical protein